MIPVILTKANFFGLPASLNFANGIVLKASKAMIQILSCIISGKSLKPVNLPNDDWLNHNNIVNNVVENINDKDAVL